MSWTNLLEIIYPVGSIYCSTLATSPAELLGGSWTKIEEAVLRSSDDAFGYTGADNHAMTIEEMPSHQHTVVDVKRAIPISSGVGYTAPVYDTYGNANIHYNGAVGGGKKCLLSNVRSTAICGIELPSIISFWGGDLTWLG